MRYGIISWGSCTNSDLLHSTEKLHCRAAKIVYNLSKGTASSEALNVAGWNTISLDYKFKIFKLFHRASKVSLTTFFLRQECSYSLRDQEAIATPRFNTRLLEDLLVYRGSVVWKFVNNRIRNVGSIEYTHK